MGSILATNTETTHGATTEFAADKLSVTTAKSTIGLSRWGKDVMISFFPVDIHGNRLKYESGIDIVYDFFLTEEQMESIIGEYNSQRTYDPFTNHANH